MTMVDVLNGHLEYELVPETHLSPCTQNGSIGILDRDMCASWEIRPLARIESCRLIPRVDDFPLMFSPLYNDDYDDDHELSPHCQGRQFTAYNRHRFSQLCAASLNRSLYLRCNFISKCTHDSDCR